MESTKEENTVERINDKQALEKSDTENIKNEIPEGPLENKKEDRAEGESVNKAVEKSEVESNKNETPDAPLEEKKENAAEKLNDNKAVESSEVETIIHEIADALPEDNINKENPPEDNVNNKIQVDLTEEQLGTQNTERKEESLETPVENLVNDVTEKSIGDEIINEILEKLPLEHEKQDNFQGRNIQSEAENILPKEDISHEPMKQLLEENVGIEMQEIPSNRAVQFTSEREKNSEEQNINQEKYDIVISLIQEFIERAELISDDSDDAGFIRYLLKELEERVMDKIDAKEVAESIYNEVVDNIQREVNISQIVITELIIILLPNLLLSIEYAVFMDSDLFSLLNEIQGHLERIVDVAYKHTKDGIIQDLLDDLLDDISKEELIEELLDEILDKATGVSPLKLFERIPSFEEIQEEEKEMEIAEPDPHICTYFEGYEACSNMLVDEAIDNAKGKIKERNKLITFDIDEPEDIDTGSSHSEDFDEEYCIKVTRFSAPNWRIPWPKICDFTPIYGKMAVSYYLSTFQFVEEWVYCVNYLGVKHLPCSDIHCYQAVWSIPTPKYPIPQVTASIFFNIDVSRVLPKNCIVKVTYQFEGTRFEHTPDKIPVSEDWLSYIMDAKINLFKTVTF